MPNWNGSDRRKRLPKDWASTRRRILRRDGGRCTETLMVDGESKRCPEPATDVDHITPGDDHSDENLRALCEWHHRKKSSREGAEAAAKARAKHARKFRRQEEHPGHIG